MPMAFFFVKLRPGADRTRYEHWLQTRDYPTVHALPSIIRYRSHRLQGVLKGEPPPFDYIETVEVRSIEEFQRDLGGPEVSRLRDELDQFIEPNSCSWSTQIAWPGIDDSSAE